MSWLGGAAIAAVALVRTIAVAVLLLTVAGFADGISAFCRSTITR